MLTPDQRHWCLEQAIEIVKHAPADSLQIHDRLKRVYKRLMALTEDGVATTDPASTTKEKKSAKKP
jgi:hypothetical protein